MKLESYLIQYTKIKSKWTKGLNLRFETTNPKLFQENKGRKLPDTEFGKDFFWTWYQNHKQQEKKNKMDFIKSKTFWASKDTINRVKSILRNERKYLQITYLIRDWCPEYTRNSYNNNKNRLKNDQELSWRASGLRIHPPIQGTWVSPGPGRSHMPKYNDGSPRAHNKSQRSENPAHPGKDSPAHRS